MENKQEIYSRWSIIQVKNSIRQPLPNQTNELIIKYLEDNIMFHLQCI